MRTTLLALSLLAAATLFCLGHRYTLLLVPNCGTDRHPACVVIKLDRLTGRSWFSTCRPDDLYGAGASSWFPLPTDAPSR